MKAGFISLGCAKNLVDTEVMLGILQEHGVELVSDPKEADVLIVNTCAFIKSAAEESIFTLLEMAGYKDTGKCKSLIIAGCLGERYQDVLDSMPEADAVVGTGAWHRIMEAVEKSLKGERVVIVGENEIIYDAKTPRIRTTPSYSAYVKIAEGCNNRCAFCAIPLIRGRYRSRAVEDLVGEATRLAEEGVIEINLVAQDTTNYGLDLYGKPSLPKLLRELAKIEKLKWIRILYAYPKFFDDELIETIAQEPKICKYIDLPLQHASDPILKKMRRPDTRKDATALIEKIRRLIPGVVIRTTLMVGFPGETEADYETLRDFAEKMRFDRMSVFTYSPEEGTPAEKFPDQVPTEVKEERYHELMSIQSKISEELNQELEGTILEVLVEGRDTEQENIAYGRSYREAPEADGCIYIEGDDSSQPGDLVRIRVAQGFTYDVVGERCR